MKPSPALICIEEKIQSCEKCGNNSKIKSYLTFKKPHCYFKSENPSILLVGHSPSVRTSEEAEYVLKFNLETRPLFTYIKNDILDPLGLKKTDIYATNLIKCKTYRMPEDIPTSVDFFNEAFANCQVLLEMEIFEIKPILILSLSERVLTILSRSYIHENLKMKDTFGKLLRLPIAGMIIPYIPLVHISKGKNSKVYQHYASEQIKRLSQLKEIVSRPTTQ